jgi:hypothetical protein
MYSYKRYSSCQIKVSCFSWEYFSFTQLTISLKAYIYKLKAIRQITIKQAFFGENYRETSTTLILYKADNGTNLTAEGILATLLFNCFINRLNLVNIDFLFSGSDFRNGQRIATYWLQFFDYPLDELQNPDITKSINPMDF